MTESFHARMPTPEEIDKLGLPAGEPVEFARGVHAASRFEWSYSFPLPD